MYILVLVFSYNVRCTILLLQVFDIYAVVQNMNHADGQTYTHFSLPMYFVDCGV